MSKKPADLKGLFNTTKAKTTKKKTTKAEEEVQEDVHDVQETKTEDVQKSAQEQQPKEEAKAAVPEKAAKKPVNFMAPDSDEDEERDLGDEFKGKIRTMQDVDKERHAKEQTEINSVQGFGLERNSSTGAEMQLSSAAASKN